MKETIMRIKGILLKLLVLAMCLPMVASAQSRQPTKTELYDQCMRRTDRPDAPLYLEDADKYQARVKANHASAISICLCKTDVQVKWIAKLRGMGFDGSKASAKRIDSDPKVAKMLFDMSLQMNEEENVCYKKFRP